jgi:hypothetical protein
MGKKLCIAAALVGVSVLLGATVLREPVALAAQTVGATIIGPLDAGGNVAVHEQGTASVNQVPVTGGGGAETDFADTDSTKLDPPRIASALIVNFERGGGGVLIFSYRGNEVLRVPNPSFDTTLKGLQVEVPLTRPVEFDELRCTIPGADRAACTAFFAGATP